MRSRPFVAPVLLIAAMLAVIPGRAEAQIFKRIKQAAKEAVAGETGNQVDRLIRNAIRCAVDDPICQQRAEDAGKDVVFVDDDGEVITDDDGAPITDRAAAVAASPMPKPGEGAWANYDFVPGDEVILFDDYSQDRVGDFPRSFELSQGNWEIVEWQGERYVRATSNGIIAIPLPETLPERFTIEYPVSISHGNAFVRIMPGRSYYGPARNYRGSVATVEMTEAGLRQTSGSQGPTALADFPRARLRDVVVAFRRTAHGEHMKVYLGEQRVANAPNAVFPRSDTLFLAVSSASEKSPIMIGAIRIAGGGRDLYGRLERDGRVATQGILFATNSDRIRPESTPTLEEIGTMLTEHPELRLSIEGHTDSDGDEAYNQTLSEQRAAAVKQILVTSYGIDEQRLETAGFGESRPAGGNDSPEGRQQNRRVELVKM